MTAAGSPKSKPIMNKSKMRIFSRKQSRASSVLSQNKVATHMHANSSTTTAAATALSLRPIIKGSFEFRKKTATPQSFQMSPPLKAQRLARGSFVLASSADYNDRSYQSTHIQGKRYGSRPATGLSFSRLMKNNEDSFDPRQS